MQESDRKYVNHMIWPMIKWTMSISGPFEDISCRYTAPVGKIPGDK